MYMAKNIANLDLGKEFKVKYDGQLHEIDANTFINSLIHLNTIIQEINQETTPNKKVEVKIKALEKGSFLVHIELVQSFLDSLPNLFSSDTLSYTGEVVSILVGLLELKNFLKAEKPTSEVKNERSVTITNNEGEVLIIENITYNIYTKNVTLNEAISKNFQTLEQDESIDGFQITDVNEKPIVKIPREYFGTFGERNPIIDQDTREVHDHDAVLSIVKLSFERRLKSEFYYKGIKITAKLSDPAFQKSIDEGRSFSKGDILKVVLKMSKVLDPAVNHFVNKGYEITKVLEHIPRSNVSSQPDLFDN
jgi:hypothetical protein